MSEVRTEPVKATHFADKTAFHDQRVAGSFRVSQPQKPHPWSDPEDADQQFWFFCPCGCGHLTWLDVGNGFKPANGPSWEWNGSIDSPTLTPSVHRVGHWHGWLRGGVWVSC